MRGQLDDVAVWGTALSGTDIQALYNKTKRPDEINAPNLGRGDQTITFGALGDQTYLVAPIELSATASSGLGVTFSVESGPGRVEGKRLTITGAGTVAVVASQAGNGRHMRAVPVTRSFEVGKAAQTITLGAIADRDFTTTPIVLSGSASSGLGVTLTVSSGPATVLGSTLTLT